MGNTVTCEGPFADIELEVQDPPLVVVDERFVNPTALTRLRMKDTAPGAKSIAFKDAVSRKVVFRSGPHRELKTLLDASKQPIVTVAKKENIEDIYYVYRLDAAPQLIAAGLVDSSDESELFQVYVKLWEMTRTSFLDTTLRVDCKDAKTGERLKVEMDGEWRTRRALLWLERSSSGARSPIGRVFRPTSSVSEDFFVDIAPNVDTAFVLLICAVVDDELKRVRSVKFQLEL